MTTRMSNKQPFSAPDEVRAMKDLISLMARLSLGVVRSRPSKGFWPVPAAPEPNKKSVFKRVLYNGFTVNINSPKLEAKNSCRQVALHKPSAGPARTTDRRAAPAERARKHGPKWQVGFRTNTHRESVNTTSVSPASSSTESYQHAWRRGNRPYRAEPYRHCEQRIVRSEGGSRMRQWKVKTWRAISWQSRPNFHNWQHGPRGGYYSQVVTTSHVELRRGPHGQFREQRHVCESYYY